MRQFSTLAVIVIVLGVLTSCSFPKPTPQAVDERTIAKAVERNHTAERSTRHSNPLKDVIIPEPQVMSISLGDVAKVETEITNLLESGAVSYPCQNVRQTLKWLLLKLKAGKAGLAVAPMATGQVVAFTQRDKKLLIPMIIFAGPVVLEKLKNDQPDVARDEIVTLLCHETLHMQLAPPGSWWKKFDTLEGRKIYVDGEAAVWSRQIETITRPMMKSGRWVDGMSTVAERQYAACGNKPNVAWREWVAQNLCVTSMK